MNSNIDMTKLRVKMKQTKVSFKLLKESDVMMKEILWGAVKYAVEVAMNNSVKKELKECELILENAEEWGPEEIQPRVVKKNEEDFLLKMLKELDIKDRKEDAKKARAAKSKAAAEAKLAAKRKNCQKITQFFQMKKKHAEASVSIEEMEVDMENWKEREVLLEGWKRERRLGKAKALKAEAIRAEIVRKSNREKLKEWLEEVLIGGW